jgi:lipopolysaccharide export system protein LptC
MTAQPPKIAASQETYGSAADKATVWGPREAIVAKSVAQSVAQYSRFVAAMKVALPVAAGLLLLMVVVLPLIRQDDDRFRIGMKLIKGSDSDALSMTNARYFGKDDKGQPYSVTAEGVRQRTNNDNAVDLVTPKAEISLNNGTFMSATASAGIYARDIQKLDLSGDVTVMQDNGNALHTSQAVVMIKDGTASGNQLVTGDGPFGTLRAEGGFDLADHGNIMHFHGPAHMTLNPRTKPDDGKSDAARPAAAETKPQTKAGSKP